MKALIALLLSLAVLSGCADTHDKCTCKKGCDCPAPCVPLPDKHPLILPSPKDEVVEGTIVVTVPPELVAREGLFMVAKEVTGDVVIEIGGKKYVGKLTFPDTKVRRTGVGQMVVDQCVASGTVR